MSTENYAENKGDKSVVSDNVHYVSRALICLRRTFERMPPAYWPDCFVSMTPNHTT